MKICYKLALIMFFSVVFSCALTANAQDKMALTITPPIIKNNVNPGQIWKSYIKVVNNNNQDIDAYVQLINFESDGETGTVKLSPLDESQTADNELLINNWIVIDKGPIKVPANKSTEIPFIVDVPEQVNPGDHHIAILIGTRPNDEGGEGSSIKVSSMLGSLLLLNVNGDVEERGEIREFSTDKGAYSSGDVKFTLRFHNTGNTILQPQGEIQIFDFRNNNKGSVKINQKTNTGNVFPDDVRRWEYAWPVPMSLMEMGRYKAHITLSYGSETKETAEQTINFWVIRWKPLLIAFGSLLFVILLAIFMVRHYIKDAIRATQEELGIVNNDAHETRVKSSDGVHSVVNLKKQPEAAEQRPKKKKIKKQKRGILFISTYVLVFALIVSLGVFVFLYLTTKEEVAMPLEELNEQSLELNND